MTFLERYQSGERERVWKELQDLGGRMSEPGIHADDWGVARETMLRARKNVETIYSRLVAAEYQFDQPDWAWNPATSDDAAAVREIESIAGPMPLSLKAWYEIVGSVWWMGAHPAWKTFGPETDALVITPVSHILQECEEWQEDRNQRFEEYAQFFHVGISPDRLHKADIGGGPPYAIACGTASADGLVKEESRRLHFVPYLRVCFQHGGFPGFEGYVASEHPLLRQLAEGLLII